MYLSICSECLYKEWKWRWALWMILWFSRFWKKLKENILSIGSWQAVRNKGNFISWSRSCEIIQIDSKSISRCQWSSLICPQHWDCTLKRRKLFPATQLIPNSSGHYFYSRDTLTTLWNEVDKYEKGRKLGAWGVKTFTLLMVFEHTQKASFVFVLISLVPIFLSGQNSSVNALHIINVQSVTWIWDKANPSSSLVCFVWYKILNVSHEKV